MAQCTCMYYADTAWQLSTIFRHTSKTNDVEGQLPQI